MLGFEKGNETRSQFQGEKYDEKVRLFCFASVTDNRTEGFKDTSSSIIIKRMETAVLLCFDLVTKIEEEDST